MLKTDNFSSFQSKYFVHTMADWNCAVDYVIKYNPQSNLVERKHSDMSALVRGFCKSEPMKWTRYIDFVVFVMNISATSARGCAPFEAMFGRLPLISLRGLFPMENDKFKGKMPDSLGEFAIKFQTLRQEMARRLGHGGITHQKSHLGVKYAQELSVKDKVYYFDSRIKDTKFNKFKSMWVGPFEIVECINECTYLIKPLGNWYEGNIKEFKASRIRLRKIDENFSVPELRHKIDIVDLSHRSAKTAEADVDFLPHPLINEHEGARKILPLHEKSDLKLKFSGSDNMQDEQLMHEKNYTMSKNYSDFSKLTHEGENLPSGLSQPSLGGTGSDRREMGLDGLVAQESSGGLEARGNGRLPMGRKAARLARTALRTLLRRKPRGGRS